METTGRLSAPAELRSLVHAERFSQDEIDRSVEKFASRFNLPPNITEPARNTLACKADTTTMQQVLEELYRDQDVLTLGLINTHPQPEGTEEHAALTRRKNEIGDRLATPSWYKKQASHMAKYTLGVAYVLPSGKKLLVVKTDTSSHRQDHARDHEVCHLLGSNKNRIGFLNYNIRTGKFVDKGVEEAVVEVLTQLARNPKANIIDLYTKFPSIREDIPNRDAVWLLLDKLYRTFSSSGKPFTDQHLAEGYFFQPTDMTVDTATPFLGKLMRHVPSFYQESPAYFMKKLNNALFTSCQGR